MGRIFALCAMVVGICAAGCGDDGGAAGDVETTIDDGPAALTKEANATFVFHSAPIGRGFVCEVDALGPGSCTSPFMTTVAEGDHTFKVSALDKKSQPDTTPAMRNWRVDLTAPETLLTKQPGAVDNTAAPSLEFSGTDTGGGTIAFECSLDAEAFAACTSPKQLALADGMHTFAVRAVDAAGNTDASPATVTWLVDTTSPDTMITSGPADASTSGPTPQFTFASSVGTATFECKLDAGAFAACTTPFTTPALNDGAHVFTVRAKDGNGVVDPSPPMRSWMVDAVAPDVAITAMPPNPSNDATPMFAFMSSDATATFECQLDNGTYAACANPFTTPALPDGANTIHVRAIDPVGNRSVTPATYAWVIDTNPPSVTITGAPPTPSNDTTPTTSFSTLGSPTTVTCQIDSGAAVACSSPYTPAALAEGTHTITVTVTDAAGNTGMAMATFVIDTTPPMVAITSGPMDPTPTNTKTPTFTFTATGATTVTCSVDGGAFAACTSPFTTAALADGSHTFNVRGTDAVGNVQTVGRTFTIDTVKPVVTITGSPANPTNQAMPQFTFTVTGGPAVTTCQVDAAAAVACSSPFTTAALTEASHTVTIFATDTAGNVGNAARTFTVDLTAPVVTITSSPPSPTSMKTGTIMFSVSGGAVSTQCQVDGGAFAACSSPFTTATLTDGSHTVIVKSLDSAGNAGTATATWTVDTGAPVVTITAGPASPTNNPIASVTFTVTGSPVSVTCQLDAGPFTACTSPYTTGSLADGSHTITVKATDAASNSGTDFRTFTIDTIGPNVAITAAPPANTNVNPASVSFSVSGGAVSTACDVDGGGFGACSSPFTTGTLSQGSHTITIKALDAVGNPGTATATFTVDTIAPTVSITAPADNSLTNNTKPPVTFTTAGSPSSTQCQIDAGAFAACSSPFTPAVALADGAHTITVKVTDLATNTSSATITINIDATKPTVVFNTVPPANTNVNPATVTFTVGGAPTVTDCSVDGGAFAVCSSPFTTATLTQGAHTIVVRVTDAATNTNQISTSFTVDTIAPTVSITTTFPNPTNNNKPPIAFTTGGAPSSIQCQIDSGAFTACTSPFTPGVALLDGPHTITVKVTDLATNTASDSVAFTVDTVKPTVTLTSVPPNPTNNNAPSISFTTAGSPTVTDCQLDGGAFIACSSPYVPGTLGEGSHTIVVRVTDAATNTNQASTTFVVDTIAPTVTVTPVPDPTKLATNLVTFSTAGSPTTIQCQIDGGPFNACTSPFSTGALADGAHTVTVKVIDAATNSSTGSTTFTVDTMAPTATITMGPANPGKDATPTVTFTTAGSPTTIQCQIDAGAFSTCTSPFTATTLADGTHSITIKVTDAAGNSSTTTTGNFVVDTVAPVITLTAVPDPTNNRTQPLAFSVTGTPTLVECETDALGFATCSAPTFTPSSMADGAHTLSVRATDAAGNVAVKTTPAFTVDGTAPVVTIDTQPPANTNDNTPSITFHTDGTETTLKCQVDALAPVTCTSPFTSGVLADGAHAIKVIATDAAGNVGTAVTSSFTIDTSAPTVAIVTQPPAQWNSTSATVTFTTAGSPTTIDCRIDGGAYAPCTTSFSASSLSEALHQVDIFVQDAAGNSTTKSVTFTVDVTPPTVAITAEPAPSSSDSTPSITFTTGGSPSTTTCQVDALAPIACSPPTFTSGSLADGVHVIKVVVTDAATNTANASTASFTIDTVAPVVTITSGPDHGWPAGNNQVFKFTATETIASYTCKVDATAAVPCTSPFSTSTLAIGAHTIKVTGLDAAGNSGSATATNEVPPTVMCLDGATGHGDADVGTLLNSLTTATFELWFRAPAALDLAMVEFDLPQLGSTSPYVALNATSNGTALLVTVDATTSGGVLNQRLFTPPASFQLADWHHYAVVFTTVTTRLFIDGVEVTTASQVAGAATATFKTAFISSPIAGGLHAGYFFPGPSEYAAGGLLDLRVSNTAVYTNAFVPVFPLTTPVASSAILQYSLNEGAGATSADDAASGKTLTWSDSQAWSATCFP